MLFAFKKHAKVRGLYNKNTRYSLDELYIHKEMMKLLIFVGVSGGLLFWGFIIGLTISVYSMDFQRLLYSFQISSALAFLPSSLGLLRMYQLRINKNKK